MVPKAGLEPARVAPLPPQDSVSTKFHHFGTTHPISHRRWFQMIASARMRQVFP